MLANVAYSEDGFVFKLTAENSAEDAILLAVSVNDAHITAVQEEEDADEMKFIEIHVDGCK